MKTNIDKLLQLKDKGLSNSEIAGKLMISTRMVEKALQLSRLHNELKGKLTADRYMKLLNLNYKALSLTKIKDNIELLELLIDSLSDKPTSKEVTELLDKAISRQNKIDELTKEIADVKAQLDKLSQEKLIIDKKLKAVKKKLDKKFKFIVDDKEITKDKKECLLKCLCYDTKHEAWAFCGFIENKSQYFRFAKNYFKQIKDPDRLYEYTYVTDMEGFIKAVKRTKNFDADFYHSFLPEEMISSSMNELNKDKVYKLDTKIKEIMKTDKELNKKLKNVTNTNVYDFMAVQQAKDFISTKDIVSHNAVSIKAMNYLKSQGYIADIEFTYDKYRFDVIGVNLRTNDIVIVETKVNVDDYIKDKKKQNYVDYCDYFYIATDNYEITSLAMNEEGILSSAGIMYFRNVDNTKKRIKVMRESGKNIPKNKLDSKLIAYKIYDKLWKKVYKI